jgi:methanogenic corrinoid protein MtbC1
MKALLSLDRETARRQMRLALADTNTAAAIETLLIPTMERIGALWEQGEVALSQVYMSGRICEGILDELLPVAEVTETEKPQVVIAVFEDNHALGKRLVVSALRVARIPVQDYGLGVTLDDLVKKVHQDRPQVLLLSVLMLRSALRVADLIQTLEAMSERPYIIVGGAPFLLDAKLWRQVGADAMATNSAETLRLLKSLRIPATEAERSVPL